MPLTQLLSSFKNRQLSQQDIGLLLSKIKQNKLTHIPLWRASTFTRLSTSTARLQAYLVIIAGLLFIPSAIYDKYQQDPSKIYRLAVYTPIATLFVLAPMYLYKKSVSKILTSIHYNVAEKSIQLQTFQNKLLQISCHNIEVFYNPQKPKIIHEIAVIEQSKKRIYKIEGYGEWQSSQVFRYLIENKGIDNIL